jgi:cytosine/adenosine deaminase-related metal-dependent hydrolase
MALAGRPDQPAAQSRSPSRRAARPEAGNEEHRPRDSEHPVELRSRALEQASDAADALGLAGVTGAIRPGLAADFVAVEGDPIADADGPGGHAGLGGLRRVRDVIQGGRPVVRDGHALV